MKKIAFLSIAIVQFFYVAAVSYPISDIVDDNQTLQSPIVKQYGLGSLFVVVLDHTMSSLKNIAVISNLIQSLPNKSEETPKNKDENSGNSLTLIPNGKPSFDLKSRIIDFNNTYVCNFVDINSKAPPCFMVLLLLMGVFLLLYRLKYFLIIAKKSSDYILSGIVETKNPNLVLPKLGFFYYI